MPQPRLWTTRCIALSVILLQAATAQASEDPCADAAARVGAGIQALLDRSCPDGPDGADVERLERAGEALDVGCRERTYIVENAHLYISRLRTLLSAPSTRAVYCEIDDVRGRMDRGEEVAKSALTKVDEAIAKLAASGVEEAPTLSAMRGLLQSRFDLYVSGPEGRLEVLKSGFEDRLKALPGAVDPELVARARALRDALRGNPTTDSEVRRAGLVAGAVVARGDGARPLFQRDYDGLSPSEVETRRRELTALRRAHPPIEPVVAKRLVALDEVRFAQLERKHAGALNTAAEAWNAIAEPMQDRRPVPAKLLAPFDDALAAPAGEMPEAALLGRIVHWEVELYRAFWSEDPDAALGRALAGHVVASAHPGKEAPSQIAVAAGSCYLLLAGHPKAWQRVWPKTNELSTELDPAELVRFDVWSLNRRFAGFCALAPGTAAVNDPDVTDWTLLTWPRARFSEQVRYRTTVRATPCDPVSWENAWSRPIPGTIAIHDGIPLLFTSERDGGHHAYELGGLATETYASAFQQDSPLDFDHLQLSTDACDGSPTLERCLAEANARWKRELDAARAVVRSARTEAADAEARAAVEALEARQTKEREAACADVRAGAGRRFTSAQENAIAGARRVFEKATILDYSLWLRARELLNL